MWNLQDTIELQRELYNFRHGMLTVTEYFIELKSMWEELEHYGSIPWCVSPTTCLL